MRDLEEDLPEAIVYLHLRLSVSPPAPTSHLSLRLAYQDTVVSFRSGLLSCEILVQLS